MKRAAVCDNFYGWRKNEEQKKEMMTMTMTTPTMVVMMMISFTLTEESTEWNRNFYFFLDFQEF
jgi:hypothetical protein